MPAALAAIANSPYGVRRVTKRIAVEIAVVVDVDRRRGRGEAELGAVVERRFAVRAGADGDVVVGDTETGVEGDTDQTSIAGRDGRQLDERLR